MNGEVSVLSPFTHAITPPVAPRLSVNDAVEFNEQQVKFQEQPLAESWA